MRVLMLVQQMDERDWLRAFIVEWVRALAAHVDHLDVLTLERGESTVPANVTIYSMGKEHGKNRARELANFHRHMLALAPRADVIFSHMTPLYTTLSTPYAALFRKRQVLWYTHRQASTQLRLALASAWRVTTAMPDSFPIPSPKVRALGHGIDTRFYSPSLHRDNSAGGEVHYIVHVARLMPIKHQATLLRAVAQLSGTHAVIVGDVPEGQEIHNDYKAGLHTLAAELGIADRVTFTGGLLAPGVRDWYRRASVAVNLSPPGLFDKAALESMATGIPTIVSNAAFDALLGEDRESLSIPAPDSVDALVTRLRALLSLNDDARMAIGARLRQNVIDSHSLHRLMPRLVQVFKTGEI